MFIYNVFYRCFGSTGKYRNIVKKNTRWANDTGVLVELHRSSNIRLCAAEAGLARLERGIGTVRHYLFVVFQSIVCSISTIFFGGYFHYLFVVLPLFVWYIFTICLWYFHYWFVVFPLFVCSISTICL